MSDLVTAVFPSPVGVVEVAESGGRIVSLTIGEGAERIEPRTGALKRAVEQLEEYFGGERKSFSLSHGVEGTGFQKRVWEAMARIPYGETRTYGALAQELGTSARAVGGACRKNPLPIIVPCHRVVAAAGLGGYSGDWQSGKAVKVKRKLLELEGALG